MIERLTIVQKWFDNTRPSRKECEPRAIALEYADRMAARRSQRVTSIEIENHPHIDGAVSATIHYAPG